MCLYSTIDLVTFPKGMDSMATIEQTYQIDITHYRDFFNSSSRLISKVLIHNDVGLKEAVSVTTTSCNYGSVRYWFVCPHCQKRCRILYWHNQRLQCRQCTQLIYDCQAYTPRNYRVWFFKARLVCLQIDPNYQWTVDNYMWFHCTAYSFFPKQPKRMKDSEYLRLLMRYLRYFDTAEDILQQKIKRARKYYKRVKQVYDRAK